jgi:endonuclease YncB( thermonuclease family)
VLAVIVHLQPRIVGIVAAVAASAALMIVGNMSAAGRDLTTRAVVDHVADGDTIEVRIGQRERYVRLIGIDTPEVYGGIECGGPGASRSIKRMLRPGDRVRLVRDPTQDSRDYYGRQLRYVIEDGRDVGRRQLRRGWAEVYVFERAFRRLGSYRRAETDARAAKRGMWGRCSR